MFRKSFVFRLRDWVGSDLYVYRFSVAIHFDLFNSLAPVVIWKAPGCVCFRLRWHPDRDRKTPSATVRFGYSPKHPRKIEKSPFYYYFHFSKGQKKHSDIGMCMKNDNPMWESQSSGWKWNYYDFRGSGWEESFLLFVPFIEFFCGHDIRLNQSWLQVSCGELWMSFQLLKSGEFDGKFKSNLKLFNFSLWYLKIVEFSREHPSSSSSSSGPQK